MFAPLFGAIRADLDRQVGWARKEARRQIRYTVLMGAIAGLAALAALGVLIVGLVALHLWLVPQIGPLAALGMIGAGLLMLMLILLLVAFALRRPALETRPALQVARPAALFRSVASVGADPAIGTGRDPLGLETDRSREGTRSELLGALALLAVVGVIAGRRLRRPEE